jgi:gamma-glutamylputrescine oxidase
VTGTDTPFWQHTVTSHDRWAASELPARTEVVVCGGGIAGAWTTYWLACRGAGVVLFEAGAPASAASGRNAGVFMPSFAEGESARMTLQAIDAEHIDASYCSEGHVALAVRPAAWAAFRAEAERNPACVRAVSRRECEQLLDRQLAPSVLGGRHYPAAGLVNPVALVYGLLAAAQRRGAVIRSHSPVERISARADGDIVVKSGNATVACRNVVLALGAATPQFIGELSGLARAVRVRVASGRGSVPRLGMAIDFGRAFWRQFEQHVIVGVVEQDAAADAFHCEPRELLARVFVGETELVPDYQWTGALDETFDSRPIVGRVPGKAGWWVIAGLGGHGLPPTAALTRALVDAVLSDAVDDPIRAVTPSRFSTPSAHTCAPRA